MAKTTTVVLPKGKRLPQGNITRLVQILRSKLVQKSYECCSNAEVNARQAVVNYLTAASKKYGIGGLAKMKIDKDGVIRVELTAKVKGDLKRIKAPYVESYVKSNNYLRVPANKEKEFLAAAKNLEDLEILLLTADSDEALTMYDTAEQQIEGIK